MSLSTIISLVAANAKVATAAAATVAVTGGGLAVATTAVGDNAHGQAGLDKAKAAHATVTDTTTDEVASTDTASVEPETADVQDVTTEAAPEDATVTPPPCPTDVKNHGAYVSSVAKDKSLDGDGPGAHGKLVSAAAKSDCGKPAKDDGDVTENSDDELAPSQSAQDLDDADVDDEQDADDDGDGAAKTKPAKTEHGKSASAPGKTKHAA